MTVAVLLEHIRGLSIEFTRAATKANAATGEGPPPPSAENLPADWREQIPSELAALAGAWQLPDAWEGETTAGGVTWPAEVIGTVAFNEVLIHGWDLAVATGQAYRPDDDHRAGVVRLPAADRRRAREPGRDLRTRGSGARRRSPARPHRRARRSGSALAGRLVRLAPAPGWVPTPHPDSPPQ